VLSRIKLLELNYSEQPPHSNLAIQYFAAPRFAAYNEMIVAIHVHVRVVNVWRELLLEMAASDLLLVEIFFMMIQLPHPSPS
jgi:hypothetical protein